MQYFNLTQALAKEWLVISHNTTKSALPVFYTPPICKATIFYSHRFSIYTVMMTRNASTGCQQRGAWGVQFSWATREALFVTYISWRHGWFCLRGIISAQYGAWVQMDGCWNRKNPLMAYPRISLSVRKNLIMKGVQNYIMIWCNLCPFYPYWGKWTKRLPFESFRLQFSNSSCCP